MVTLAIVLVLGSLITWALLTSRKQLVFSKGDAGWFLLCYTLCFLTFRFDMPWRHGPWFQHPMPSARAACMALLVAVLTFFAAKIKLAGDRESR
jgi:hypothetical protein